MDALTKYYHAKEREESAVLYIEDSYLEAVNSLEKIETENARLRELVDYMTPIALYSASDHERDRICELGVEVTS